MTRDRRNGDRTIERLRQLRDRLDALLHESQELRNIDTEELTTWPTVRDHEDAPEDPRPPGK